MLSLIGGTQKKTARKGGYSIYNLRLTIYRLLVIKSSPAILFGREMEKKTTIRGYKKLPWIKVAEG